MEFRLVGRAALVLVMVAGAGACSGGDEPAAGPSATMLAPGRPGESNRTVVRGPASAAPATAADLRFVQMMIPHHEQALQMAALVPHQGADPRVKKLADRIDKAQTVEISAMQSWLKQHAPGRDPGGHAGHGGAAPSATAHADMPGMATAAQLAQLRAARGAEFDRLFLTLMIAHHQGALTMAREALKQPGDQIVQSLARDVLTTQNAEINRMRALLDG